MTDDRYPVGNWREDSFRHVDRHRRRTDDDSSFVRPSAPSPSHAVQLTTTSCIRPLSIVHASSHTRYSDISAYQRSFLLLHFVRSAPFHSKHYETNPLPTMNHHHPAILLCILFFFASFFHIITVDASRRCNGWSESCPRQSKRAFQTVPSKDPIPADFAFRRNVKQEEFELPKQGVAKVELAVRRTSRRNAMALPQSELDLLERAVWTPQQLR